MVEWLEGLDPGGGPLLDVGCGSGRHTAAARGLGLRAVGIDASKALLGLARAADPDAGLVLGDAAALPIGSGVAAAVLAAAVLHHLPPGRASRAAADEFRRVTAPGAEVLASVWALDDPIVRGRARARPLEGGDDTELLVPWRAAPGGPVDRYYRAVTLDGLAGLVEGAGLEVLRAWDEGDNHVVRAIRP